MQYFVHICYLLLLHSKKNLSQQMGMVLLLWQVGLIANVKLHFLGECMTE